MDLGVFTPQMLKFTTRGDQLNQTQTRKSQMKPGSDRYKAEQASSYSTDYHEAMGAWLQAHEIDDIPLGSSCGEDQNPRLRNRRGGRNTDGFGNLCRGAWQHGGPQL